MEIQLWREILSPYELAVNELVEKFNHLMKEHKDRGLYSPIEQVTGRVKSVTSITHMKESGYRSYHLVIYYQVETLNGPKKLQAEIQIRTMAMNFWATIEHSLQYKYKTNIPPHVKERLSKAADAIIALDNEMSSVRNEIMNAQNSSLIQRTLVMDILTNIENLYLKSNKREVEKIQTEFYRIYESNDLQQLKKFHQQLDIIAEGYRAQAITNDFSL